jgi:uncharacterized protein YbcI
MDSSSNLHRGEVLAQISNGLVRLQTQFYGKGPREAKSYYVDDLVVCVMQGGLTKVEQTLNESGRGMIVREMREGFQDVMRDQFIGVVEDATGRKVAAYMSQVHLSPDLCVEIFSLEHDGQD